MHFIDVGQGDSILILAPDGTTTLIDGGNANSEALAYLQSLGTQHITPSSIPISMLTMQVICSSPPKR